ncbi:MAG: SDR family NAD(P)-dependent oxidoreductase [Nocardioidaceae bacterium]
MSRPTALVTGATAGLGNAFARELAGRGYDLVLVARDKTRLEDVRADLERRHGTGVTVIGADLATRDGVTAVAAAIEELAVDLLVNNAGASLGRFFGETAIEDEDRQLDLLVRAPMHLADAALRSMLPRGGGRIVNVSSVAAFTPRGTYSAHKAWVANLSQWMNIAYADRGVVTMALCPGFTRTEFHQRMNVDTDEIPRWMWLRADDVVRAALADLDKGRAISIPSVRYKVLGTLARYAPPRLVARAAKLGRRVRE